MKTRCKFEKYLCAAVLAVGFFVFSALCWFQLACAAGRSLLSRGQQAEESAPTVQQTDDAKSAENAVSRLLTRLDSISEKLDDKFGKHIFEKPALSALDSIVTRATTGQIISFQVVQGKEGWLFYKHPTDGDCIADFEGTDLYSEELLRQTADAALRLQEATQRRQAKFLLVLPPNKSNVYPEYMPEDLYTHAAVSRADLLVSHLREQGVHVLSLKDCLLARQVQTPCYFKYDTHWNQVGAYLGVREILAQWQIEMPDLQDRTISAVPFSDGDTHPCDLARMIGMSAWMKDDAEYSVNGTAVLALQALEESEEPLFCFTNLDAVRDETLLLVGDSFRTAMLPSLSEMFRTVYVCHRSNFLLSYLDEVKPDYVVYQYVERYAGSIAEQVNGFLSKEN